MDNIQVSCGFCHRKIANLKRCSRCLSVFYCSKVCQCMDWLSHKSTCAKQTETCKKTAQTGISSDYKTSFENHTTSGNSSKNHSDASKTHNFDLDTTQRKASYGVYRRDTDFDDNIEAKIEMEYSTSKVKRKVKDDKNSNAAGSGTVVNVSSCNIRDADIENIQNESDLRNDQIEINMSNAKSDSGVENTGSVVSDCSVTFACGEGKGVSVKTFFIEEKGGSGTNASGEETDGTGTITYGEEKRDSSTNDCGEEKDGSDTYTSGGKKGDSVTNDCGEKRDDWITNDCEEEKSGSVANDSGKEQDGSIRNACGKKKGGSVANNCKEQKDGTNLCGSCGSQGSFKKCSRCKAAFYCSKECQKKDWPTHKSFCTEKLTEEEKIKAVHEKMIQENKVYQRFKDYEADESYATCEFFNYKGPSDRIVQMLTLEEALHRATRPSGSLQRASRLARSFFSIHDIVTNFDDIPWEQVFPFFPLMFRPQRSGYVLVAFMYRYHEHVMRHGVYLKDEEDKESKVEFYLDDFDDNPFPFFSYSQVKPGGYICLVDPVMHMFGDRTVGIRINNPAKVMVMNIEMVMK